MYTHTRVSKVEKVRWGERTMRRYGGGREKGSEKERHERERKRA